MPVGEVHNWDFGTRFELTVKDQDSNVIDLSNASVKQIMFQRSDANTLIANLGCNTNCSDGVVVYTAVSGDLSLTGIWAFQCYFSTPSGTWFSDIVRFPVYENLYIGSQ